MNTTTTTEKPVAVPLKTALAYAGAVVPWLEPFCERIEIAGSVRRQRPICNDLDVVCIPKVDNSASDPDLFGRGRVAPTNKLHEFLTSYVRHEPQAHWKAGQHKPAGEIFSLQLPRCQLDIFIATPATFGVVLLCRTGSKEHNIWLASRAKARGWHWNPQWGLRIYETRLERTVAATEQDIYTALDLPFIIPQNRELAYLLRNFREAQKL